MPSVPLMPNSNDAPEDLDFASHTGSSRGHA